jgi:hypothetical protein
VLGIASMLASSGGKWECYTSVCHIRQMTMWQCDLDSWNPSLLCSPPAMASRSLPTTQISCETCLHCVSCTQISSVLTSTHWMPLQILSCCKQCQCFSTFTDV